MKLKKIPYHFTLFILASGASLILGFLSFGGMLVISPYLPLAFASFALSVAYEGEIYFQNIKGALNKLFKHNHMKIDMAKAYLLELFVTKKIDTSSGDCPQFFKDYQAQCELMLQFEHKTLDTASLKRKIKIEKTLRDMEKWFARQLFNQGENNTLIVTDYQQKLQDWLKNNDQSQQILDFNARKTNFHRLKIFGSLAAIFMGLGTTYLLMEAFSVIPLLATLSATTVSLLIVPMALIAGAAYGLLTYNAMTDMLTNNLVLSTFKRIFQSNEKWTLRRGLMATVGILLATLALTLTVCTMGTWWTIAKEVPPLFGWMKKLPGAIMGVINPIITGISALIFNLQNTAESLEVIEEFSPPKDNPLQKIKNIFIDLQKNEHWSQWINPFRLLLKLTFTPLRIILFFGHLISIGVTADRVPGISQILSAIIGIISEGFEDLHYFVDHGDNHDCEDAHKDICAFLSNRLGQGHGHNHDLDLPTRALKFVFYPLYWLADRWDYFASRQFNKTRPLTVNEACNEQQGNSHVHREETVILDDKNSLSVDWHAEHMVYRIERYKEKKSSAAILSELSSEETTKLTALQNKLSNSENRQSIDALRLCISAQDNQTSTNQHRFWSQKENDSKQFVNEYLPNLLPAQSVF